MHSVLRTSALAYIRYIPHWCFHLIEYVLPHNANFRLCWVDEEEFGDGCIIFIVVLYVYKGKIIFIVWQNIFYALLY